jgi:hypothetical protein
MKDKKSRIEALTSAILSRPIGSRFAFGELQDYVNSYLKKSYKVSIGELSHLISAQDRFKVKRIRTVRRTEYEFKWKRKT